MTVPLLVGIGALLFASYGTGNLAEWFRGKIIDTFGKGMIPGARWFAIIMVSVKSIFVIFVLGSADEVARARSWIYGVRVRST